MANRENKPYPKAKSTPPTHPEHSFTRQPKIQAYRSCPVTADVMRQHGRCGVTHMNEPRKHLQPAIIAVTLTAVALCTFLAWRANAPTEYHMTLQCVTLPETDRPLSEWLQEQDHIANVVVSRDNEGINLDYMNVKGEYELAQIPLAELGYSGVTAMKTDMTKPSFAGVPLFVCYGVVAIVVVLIGATVSSCIHKLQSPKQRTAAAPDA